MVSPVAALNAPTRARAGPAYVLAGLLCALAVLIPGGPARGAAVVEGPRSDVSTVTCSIEEGGTTTCAVSQGAAAVCSLRKGQDI